MSFLGHPTGTKSGDGRPEDKDDLLVFGYACKLYRDDAKAIAEDSGVYLIPWMGDHSLMIDRYDCRGHLYDKGQFGLKSNLPHRWTAKEEEFEEMLDRERYMALNEDLREEDIRREEEEKRMYEAMQEGYSAVGFQYSDSTGTEQPPATTKLQPPAPPPLSSVIVDRPDDEDVYTVPVGLNLPAGIETPTTNKLHSIIERTALFISQQGTQMEIRIKINQKNNPYFAFMDINDRLHPYYKHLLRVVTNGNYTPKPVVQPEPKPTKNDSVQQLEQSSKKDIVDDESSDEDSDGDYELHPSLLGSRTTTNSTSQDSSTIGQNGDVMSSQMYSDSYQQQMAYAYYMDQAALYNSGYGGIMPGIPMNALIEDPPHPPPPDLQPIIDKLAEYVAKHGNAFEDTVKRNGDPRLQFINSDHEYYKYFMLRKNLYQQKFMMEEMTNKNNKTPAEDVTDTPEPPPPPLPSPPTETSKDTNTSEVQALKEDGSVEFKIASKEEKVMSGVYLGSASDDEEEGEGNEDDGEGTCTEEDKEAAGCQEEQETAVPSEPPQTSSTETDGDDTVTSSTAKKTTTVITTTALPKLSLPVEEQEKMKNERRKKAAMFVEKLRQKRADKIAKETDIIGPLLPHEYKYCNRKYVELLPTEDHVTESNDKDDDESDEESDEESDGENASKRLKLTVDFTEEEEDFILNAEPSLTPRLRTRLSTKSKPKH